MPEVELEEYVGGVLKGKRTTIVPDTPMSQEKIQRAAALTLLSLVPAGASAAVRLTAIENAIKALAADTGP